jgi:putative endonuclease
MWFSKKEADKSQGKATNSDLNTKSAIKQPTKSVGDAAEAMALDYLRKAGLSLLDTNYRTPGRGGGEIDLVMRDKDGTLVFVEVRQRASASHGGAGASISAVKQRRIVFAARHYLMRFKTLPPCRFDVVLIHGSLGQPDKPEIEWLRSAFDAF